ncbi:hypothetical protein PMAYCL1PPCAC_19064, partial [Pristionchus mayeri]
ESSNWMYYEAMEFLQPHLRDKTFIIQQHHEMFARSHSDASTKWRMEEQSMMKEVDDGSSSEKKLRLDEESGAGVAQQPGSIMVDTDESSATGVEEQDQRTTTSVAGEYHRDMLLRMGNRHYPPHVRSQDSPTTVRWNTQDEDDVFGHMIALKLAKMDPRFKEAVKVKIMQTFYDAQFGPDTPPPTVAQR